MLPDREEIATVVVCEDDEATLELLCDHLTADRFEAMPAPSASDALRLCHYKQPDLLLLDLALPDASGLDVLREIRDSDGIASRFDPLLPVIVLTGRSADADRVKGFRPAPTTTSSTRSRLSRTRLSHAASGRMIRRPGLKSANARRSHPFEEEAPPRRSGCTRLGAERSPVQIRPPR